MYILSRLQLARGVMPQQHMATHARRVDHPWDCERKRNVSLATLLYLLACLIYALHALPFNLGSLNYHALEPKGLYPCTGYIENQTPKSSGCTLAGIGFPMLVALMAHAFKMHALQTV